MGSEYYEMYLYFNNNKSVQHDVLFRELMVKNIQKSKKWNIFKEKIIHNNAYHVNASKNKTVMNINNDLKPVFNKTLISSTHYIVSSPSVKNKPREIDDTSTGTKDIKKCIFIFITP